MIPPKQKILAMGNKRCLNGTIFGMLQLAYHKILEAVVSSIGLAFSLN